MKVEHGEQIPAALDLEWVRGELLRFTQLGYDNRGLNEDQAKALILLSIDLLDEVRLLTTEQLA